MAGNAQRFAGARGPSLSGTPPSKKRDGQHLQIKALCFDFFFVGVGGNWDGGSNGQRRPEGENKSEKGKGLEGGRRKKLEAGRNRAPCVAARSAQVQGRADHDHDRLASHVPGSWKRPPVDSPRRWLFVKFSGRALRGGTWGLPSLHGFETRGPARRQGAGRGIHHRTVPSSRPLARQGAWGLDAEGEDDGNGKEAAAAATTPPKKAQREKEKDSIFHRVCEACGSSSKVARPVSDSWCGGVPGRGWAAKPRAVD